MRLSSSGYFRGLRLRLIVPTSVLCAACGAAGPDSGKSGAGSAPAVAAPALAPGSAAELARIQSFLDARYTAAEVHGSFHTKFGETVDCVDFYAQPGVKALAARGVAVSPPAAPTQTSPLAVSPSSTGGALADVAFNGQPDDQGRPQSCPGATVPMLRTTVDEVLAHGGLDKYLRARSVKAAPPVARPVAAFPDGSDLPGYSHVIVSNPNTQTEGWTTTSTTPPWGVGSVSNGVPNFQGDDHALSQLWMLGNSSSGLLQSVELGWNVDHALYAGNGSNSTHLFIYATNSNYQGAGAGCYNNQGTTCLTFILTPGATFTPGQILSMGGNLGSAEGNDLSIEVDATASGWELRAAPAGQRLTSIGYYPYSDYTGSMASGVSELTFEVGNEVYDATGAGGVPMGTGSTATAGYTWSAVHHDYGTCLNQPGACGYFVATPSVTTSAPIVNYEYSQTTPAGSASWNNYFYVGDAPAVFAGTNYGYSAWNPVGFDWAPNDSKADCEFTGQGAQPIVGISAFTWGQQQAHAVVCAPGAPVATNGGSCVIENFDNSLPGNSSWAWDPSYNMAECPANYFAQGVSQDANGNMTSLLCCPASNNTITIATNTCSLETFFNQNSPDFWESDHPDWDDGFYKGQCSDGMFISGVSAIASSSQGPTGAPHALLCCNVN